MGLTRTVNLVMFMYCFTRSYNFFLYVEALEILISSNHFLFHVPDQTFLAQNSSYMIRSLHALLSILRPQDGRAVGLLPKRSPQKSQLAATTLLK